MHNFGPSEGGEGAHKGIQHFSREGSYTSFKIMSYFPSKDIILQIVSAEKIWK